MYVHLLLEICHVYTYIVSQYYRVYTDIFKNFSMMNTRADSYKLSCTEHQHKTADWLDWALLKKTQRTFDKSS